ncbi:choice-of-anchor O protein [Methylohalobius crimeensis]|uniref:choice-of-anchor O protein n=1 Tax=Methylohalobius crimeensis TaxID=244365 RepID=UPI0003F6E05B|nr:choice-of-anchor O protein [Methylohalobius crimeensis]
MEGNEEIGFTGHGKREAYAAVSLDDGNTWKLTNLSESADQSSADFDRTDVSLYSDDGINYPGDVLNIAQATAGDHTIVAWFSRYCGSGQPNYALESGDSERRAAIADYLGIDLNNASYDDLYLTDMYRVSGQQQSVDYAEDEFEKNQIVGEVPYACLWTARGTLEQQDDDTYQVVWRKAERLTSGRRDVNRVEVDMVEGVGAVITWQEDPEGLRPGQGLGPGAGWSGAVANHETDVWYSFIEWDHFGLVQQENEQGDSTGEIVALADYTGTSNRPKVGIPVAMPMRVTDNAKCNVDNPAPYCNGSAIQNQNVLNPLAYGMKDMCADTVNIPTGPQGTPAPVCVTEDGLPLVGNTASTRPRVNLFGYDSNRDGVNDSGWVVFVTEESKGLGRFAFDQGKNMWYHTFSMSLFDTRATEENGLMANLAGHGNMLNQPAVDWETGAFYQAVNTSEFWDFGDYNYDVYETEIARRGSLLAQNAAKVDRRQGSFAHHRLTALPTWKQGIMQQGGPADVMARRILLPRRYREGVDNPYAFTNMACDEWAYADGSNPYYPDGLCLEPALNLSSVTPDTCVDNATGDSVDCPKVENGIGDTNPILRGSDVPVPNTTKVFTWHQCPNDASVVSSSDEITPVTVCADNATNRANNFTDQSWYNPLDVAKGHRGFIDGDFIMILYAWSPNWKLNTEGKDRYELYVRRSFDGGQTWTMLPTRYRHYDRTRHSGQGAVTCETFRGEEGAEQPKGCFSYGAGGAEQARNVSQLKSMAFTILDPRYSETAPTIPDSIREGDTRDPSRYFIVYETGDNRTVEFGEAESLNLFYSRGVHFGDNYQVWAEEDDLSVCYPSDAHDDPDVSDVVAGSGFCNEFDDLEGKQDIASGEGSIEANPSGEWLYGVWSQTDETTGESDAMWRRVWYLDGYISEDFAWITGQGPN